MNEIFKALWFAYFFLMIFFITYKCRKYLKGYFH